MSLAGITMPTSDQIRILGHEVYEEYNRVQEGNKQEKASGEGASNQGNGT